MKSSTFIELFQIFRKVLNLIERLGLIGTTDYLAAKAIQVVFPNLQGLITLHPKNAVAPLCCRVNTSDISVFWSIFCKQSYSFLGDIKPKTIVDLGANIGVSSAYFLSRYEDANLIAVEPDPESFRLLERNLRSYNTRVKMIYGGVWSSCIGLKIRRSNQGAWATLVEPCLKNEEYDILGLDMLTIMDRARIEKIDLLKVDIEGAEKEMFLDCSSWIDKVSVILIELHGKECHNTFFRAIEGKYEHFLKNGELTMVVMTKGGNA